MFWKLFRCEVLKSPYYSFIHTSAPVCEVGAGPRIPSSYADQTEYNYRYTVYMYCTALLNYTVKYRLRACSIWYKLENYLRRLLTKFQATQFIKRVLFSIYNIFLSYNEKDQIGCFLIISISFVVAAGVIGTAVIND